MCNFIIDILFFVDFISLFYFLSSLGSMSLIFVLWTSVMPSKINLLYIFCEPLEVVNFITKSSQECFKEGQSKRLLHFCSNRIHFCHPFFILGVLSFLCYFCCLQKLHSLIFLASILSLPALIYVSITFFALFHPFI